MYGNHRKLAAVLILVSFIFGTVSPAMAAATGNGIAKGYSFQNIGDTTNFAGYNWTLYNKDSTYGYIITSNVMDLAKSDGSGKLQYYKFRDLAVEWNSKLYSYSDLRKTVNGYEAEMKKYSGADVTWAEANGTAEGKNYIVKHNMTETGSSYYTGDINPGFTKMSDYNDLLYILSVNEAQAVQDAGYGHDGSHKNIVNCQVKCATS